jgi:Protein of unknown function (DUF3037)
VPRSPFQYAVVRVVPQVERGECVNAGVVVFARTCDFLEMRVDLSRSRLTALAPSADYDDLSGRLDGLARIAAGDETAGPIARLDQHQRFHWLVAPSSTVIQPSAVHTGICDDPAQMVDNLFRRLVAAPEPEPD